MRRTPGGLVLVALGSCVPAASLAQEADSVATAAVVGDHSVFGLPSFYYSPETGWGGGAGAIHTYRYDVADTVRRSTSTAAYGVYTTRSQLILGLDTDWYGPDNRTNWTGGFAFSRFPGTFWGVGLEAPDSAEEDFTTRSIRWTTEVRRRLGESLYVGVAWDYGTVDMREVEEGGLLDRDAVPGADGGRLSGPGGSVSRDTRDRVFATRRGVLLSAQARWFAGWSGSDYEYGRLTLEGREYAPLGPGWIALRQRIAGVGADAPFFDLPQLGGASMLRGYFEGRYRDRYLAVAEAEYRVPLFWRFGAVAFAGAGTVSSDVDGLAGSPWRPSAGLGLRVAALPEEGVNIRLDYGIGEGGASGFYISFGEAF